MTDTVADLNQVKIAMLRSLAAEPQAQPRAARWDIDTGDDGPTRQTLVGASDPEAQNRIDPGEQK